MAAQNLGNWKRIFEEHRNADAKSVIALIRNYGIPIEMEDVVDFQDFMARITQEKIDEMFRIDQEQTLFAISKAHGIMASIELYNRLSGQAQKYAEAQKVAKEAVDKSTALSAELETVRKRFAEKNESFTQLADRNVSLGYTIDEKNKKIASLEADVTKFKARLYDMEHPEGK